jgi:preprotein translocase subunit SecG
MLITTLIIVDVIAGLLLILFVLLHAGRGGGLSDMFGGGAGLSGGTAVERNLDRITVVTASIFAVTTFYLAWKWE